MDLDTKDYIVIDFKGFIKVINIMNGVEINVEEKEIKGLNKVINTCYGLNIGNKGNNMEYIINSSNQVLNGYQALAYSRLRKIDDCFHIDTISTNNIKICKSKYFSR